MRSTGDGRGFGRLAVAVALASGASACGQDDRCDADVSLDITLCDEDTVACRPYELLEPPTEEGPLPLLIFLHGYGGNSTSNLEHLSLSNVAMERGWLVAIPTGTHDVHGCNTWSVEGYGSGRNDTDYLDALVADVRERHDVSRVMVLGYSIGGSFAFQYSCERPETVDAVASLAGNVRRGLACPAPSAATLLAIGDEDQGFPGARSEDFFRARDSANHLAIANACTSGPLLTGRVRALVPSIATDVEVRTYGGCNANTEVWIQLGVDHSLGGGKAGAVDSSDVLNFLQNPMP